MLDLRAIPVRDVRGVGVQKEEALHAFGIHTVYDLIFYFPYRYEDYRIRDLSLVKDGDKVTVEAQIYAEPYLQMLGRKKSRMTCKVVVDRFLITAVWFNRHFLKERLTPGHTIVLTGKWEAKRKQITVTEFEFPGAKDAVSGTIQPVYSVGGDITQKWLRKTIQQAFTQFGPHIEEVLPEELVSKYRLIPRPHAIHAVHNPAQLAENKQARERMVYEELFLFQLKLQAYRVWSKSKADGVAQAFEMEDVRAFVRSLPFTLTTAQKNVIADILRDMKSPYVMNRLLQGDVGSGKTVVAACALYATVKAGFQGALMVPTEILAEQHATSLSRLFEPFGLQVGLLTGSLTERQKRDIQAALQMGMLDIVVGTHALIQEGVFFRQLGLVVVDEQHRFGVQHRSLLRRKGLKPDILTMTATPIPRTLAISVFGDLDVSTLDERPKGRKPIQTFWVKHDLLPRVIAFIRKEAAAGRQAYVICPLIEESEKIDVQNAIDVHAQLQQNLTEFKIGLLHGRMGAHEKDEAMQDFKALKTQVIVSTTVIEVGVDVPNATLMVIYDADRFGLSQLHQLRGRVGRGEHQSYCVLIADPKTESGVERMQVMVETDDGFAIARKDLEMRGPGEVFGTKQSGVPEFKLADLLHDFEWLEKARDDVAELLQRSEFWTAIEYTPLRDYLHHEQVLFTENLD